MNHLLVELLQFFQLLVWHKRVDISFVHVFVIVIRNRS